MNIAADQQLDKFAYSIVSSEMGTTTTLMSDSYDTIRYQEGRFI